MSNMPSPKTSWDSCRENFISDLIHCKDRNIEECLKAFYGDHTSCSGVNCPECAFNLDNVPPGVSHCALVSIRNNLNYLKKQDTKKLKKSRDSARILDIEWSNFCSNFSCCTDCPLDSAHCYSMRDKINQYHKNITLNLKEEKDND